MRLLQPFRDTLQVKGMPAHPPHDWAIVTRILSIRRTAIKMITAYTTNIVACIPCPIGNGVPVLDFDFKYHL